MQLKIQRSQRLGGLTGRTVFFCLDVRAAYDPVEAANISRYKIGSEIIYSSQASRRHLEKASASLDAAGNRSDGLAAQYKGLASGLYSLAMAKVNLNISIASLGKGHHIECKDLAELAEAEEAVMQACRNIRDYLKLAASFNGSTILVDFSNGEEVHIAEQPPALSNTPNLHIEAYPDEALAVPASDPESEWMHAVDRGTRVCIDFILDRIAPLREKIVADPIFFGAAALTLTVPIMLWIVGPALFAAIMSVVAIAGVAGMAALRR